MLSRMMEFHHLRARKDFKDLLKIASVFGKWDSRRKRQLEEARDQLAEQNLEEITIDSATHRHTKVRFLLLLNYKMLLNIADYLRVSLKININKVF